MVSGDDASTASCAGSAPTPPCNEWASRAPMGPANELSAAVDPMNDLHVVVAAKDYSLGASGDCASGGAYHVWAGIYDTRDGGATWTTTRIPGWPGGPASVLSSIKCSSDPAVRFAPDGTAWFIGLNFQYTGGRAARVYVARSSDGGSSWPASDIVAFPATSGTDKEWLAVGPDGSVHVAWVDVDTGAIWYSHDSPSAPLTFIAPYVAASAGFGNPAVEPIVHPDGTVFLFWRDGNQIRFETSANGGASFGTPRVALTVSAYDGGNDPRAPFMPQVAVGANGHIVLVWPDARGGDADVYFSRSADKGATWSTPRRIDDNVVPRAKQLWPTVAIAPNGVVAASWLDQRDPGTSDLWRAYGTTSADGGATWSANRMLELVPTDAKWSHHQSGAVFLGDYQGIAANDRYTYSAFVGNGIDRAPALTGTALERGDAYVAPQLTPAPTTDFVSPLEVGAIASVPAPAAVFDPVSLSCSD